MGKFKLCVFSDKILKDKVKLKLAFIWKVFRK